MDNLPELLQQPTPWGLTIGQTAVIALITFVLVFGWTIIKFFLQLTGTIFRVGCAAVLIFVCGLVSFMVFYNISTR